MRCRATAAAAASQLDSVGKLDKSHNVDAKPFSEMPGHSYSFVSAMVEQLLHKGKTHKLVMQKFQKYGSVFRESIAKFNMVYVSDVDAIETIHRTDAMYPKRVVVDPWLHYRSQRNLPKGILIQ